MELMVLEVSSNLNDSVILRFSGGCRSKRSVGWGLLVFHVFLFGFFFFLALCHSPKQGPGTGNVPLEQRGRLGQ